MLGQSKARRIVEAFSVSQGCGPSSGAFPGICRELGEKWSSGNSFLILLPSLFSEATRPGECSRQWGDLFLLATASLEQTAGRMACWEWVGTNHTPPHLWHCRNEANRSEFRLLSLLSEFSSPRVPYPSRILALPTLFFRPLLHSLPEREEATTHLRVVANIQICTYWNIPHSYWKTAGNMYGSLLK